MEKSKANVDKKKLTPMMKQYYEIKEQYQEYILFYRLGDFYEMFFDDAITASRELEITLTGRNCGLAEKAPLCGIPYHAVDGYLKKIVEKGYKVAICEQVEDPALAKGIVKREVVRVITPGTIIDPNMLTESDNNYLMSIFEKDNKYSIAFCDITTGMLKTSDFNSINNLIDEILRINPSEIIIEKDKEFSEAFSKMINELRKLDFIVSQFNSSMFNFEIGKKTIQRILKVYSIESIGLMDRDEVVSSLGGLLSYIEETSKVPLVHITEVDVYSNSKFMILDKFTRRNLELTETMRNKEKKGSLLWVLDKTSTAMGARMLKSWIEEPLVDVKEIEGRLSTVQVLVEDLLMRSDLREFLKRVYDLERISTKIVYGNINPRDLIALKNSLGVLPEIKELIKDNDQGNFKYIYDQIDLLTDVKELIEKSIIDEPPYVVKDGGVIKSRYNEELDELRDIENKGKSWILEVEARERENTGIKNLKIGFNKVFGYYLEATKANAKFMPETYTRKQTLANAERYITPELKEIEEKILGAKEKINRLEIELFNGVKDSMISEVNRILALAKGIASLDALISFAEASYRYGYKKPKVNSNGDIQIKDGRHPVVERIFNDEPFIPNDTTLNCKDDKFYIITGPNMAGKSTYLRQVAIITLMAQIGCFVPAEKATIGVVDRIFTRVGASDDLSRGQSTFMVEMNELANILNNATSNSLIILDEIGRGTSTYDGLSIAWSVVEYIAKTSKLNSKTMFATHYHELTELEGKIEGVKNYRISVKNYGDDIVFLRKIERGGANQSYGIQVAKLAGVPEDVISRAKEILKKLEIYDINNNISNINDLKVAEDASGANDSYIPMDHNKYKEVVEHIENIKIDEITLIDAMNELHKIYSDIKKIN